MNALKLPKPIRQKDEAYLDHIRSMSCCICLGNWQAEAHHIVSRGAGGSDYRAVPLCREHHHELHYVGRARFEEEHGISLDAVNSTCLASYIGMIKGEA